MSLISKICIELEDGTELELNKYEALKLYNELDSMFGGVKPVIYPYPFPNYPYITWDGTTGGKFTITNKVLDQEPFVISNTT